MVQDRLGLFDTPPGRGEIRVGLSVVILLFTLLSAILLLQDVQLVEVPAFIPMINGIMLVGETVTATLLFAQAAVFRSRALIVLASGFLGAALLLIPHALTFPGAFSPEGLLGAGVNSTAWIASIRRAAFPVFIILYVVIRRREDSTRPGDERPTLTVGAGVFAGIVFAGAATFLSTLGHDLLPPYFIDRSHLIQSHALGYQSVLLVLFAIAALMLFKSRRSVLDMWLLVALGGWLAETLLVLTLQGRFTAGWYGLFVLTLLSHLVVMLALIAESNRLYARLALSTADARREREARLMSMDAVTAAISHEVGQPLTAVSLSAAAGLNWLTQTKPDIAKATDALRHISEDSKRTFDVIRSIRGMFGKPGGRLSNFSLNELVRETVSALERELASAKVSLAIDLDEALPPIHADRVQIQRVLINLMTNGMQSLGPIPGRYDLRSKGRPRNLTVSSGRLDPQHVYLKVSDTGCGIAAGDMERIFDPFYTTKANGTGLGLPLCRSIVRDHQGRLWASQGEECGAVFQLELPRGVSPSQE